MSQLFEQVYSCLPQTQCQLCGYPDCESYARAVVAGESVHLCQPGGKRTCNQLQEITGTQASLGKISSYHRVVIDEQECIGCFKCVHACPVQAIVGTAKHMHTVIASDCTGCDLCIPACPVDCIHPVDARDPLELYTGNAIASAYKVRERSYQRKQRQEALAKRRPAVVTQAQYTVSTNKQKTGRYKYQLLRIEKAILACRKKGDMKQIQKLTQQKQRLLT